MTKTDDWQTLNVRLPKQLIDWLQSEPVTKKMKADFGGDEMEKLSDRVLHILAEYQAQNFPEFNSSVDEIPF